jgi:hypothetical protein
VLTEGIPALAMRNPVGVEAFTDIVNDLIMLEAPAKETVHG